MTQSGKDKFQLMSTKIYEYKGCSTCQKALKFLDSRKVAYEKKAIADEPPTKAELKRMLELLRAQGGSIKNLFNTSGLVYREMKLGEKLANMSEADALTLLSKNGKLVKRPFVLTAKTGLVGFKEAEWKKVF